MSSLTYYPFHGGRPVRFYSSHPFGAWGELIEWLSDNDEAEADLYRLVEMFTDEEAIEVVTRDGEPVGVLDNASIGLADLARFETYEEMERREGEEDAHSELVADVRRETRNA